MLFFSDDEVCYNRGNDWLATGEYDKAIADYTRALQLNPSFAVAYTNRGIAWCRKGEYDKAIADYHEALRLDPNDVDTYTNRGAAWDHKGKYDEAIADFNQALRLDPNHADVYYNRAITWKKKGQHDKAIADYKQSIKLNPNDADFYTNLALLQATSADETCRDAEAALANAKKAYELTGGTVWQVADTLAAAYAECGDFENACKWERRAITLAAKVAAGEDIEEARNCLELYRRGEPYHEERTGGRSTDHHEPTTDPRHDL